MMCLLSRTSKPLFVCVCVCVCVCERERERDVCDDLVYLGVHFFVSSSGLVGFLNLKIGNICNS